MKVRRRRQSEIIATHMGSVLLKDCPKCQGDLIRDKDRPALAAVAICPVSSVGYGNTMGDLFRRRWLEAGRCPGAGRWSKKYFAIWRFVTMRIARLLRLSLSGIFITLLAIIMVACDDEPTPRPDPTPNI